ncbi:hypothetical protein TNIN_151361 [Trichonephila inaurata madagascariensis]|uniref:Uncharacterized protein n=1 Tax=Trichonephila inaurata madagascariensis TaxID=2747483 RepID=A0A8X6YCG6_9ARAC|nr:hypothetical protein TNIN_151361 [Trichonephila inaurata madagascariensis]
MPTEQEVKSTVVTPSLQQWRCPSTFRVAPGEDPLKWLTEYDRVTNFNKWDDMMCLANVYFFLTVLRDSVLVQIQNNVEKEKYASRTLQSKPKRIIPPHKGKATLPSAGYQQQNSGRTYSENTLPLYRPSFQRLMSSKGILSGRFVRWARLQERA